MAIAATRMYRSLLNIASRSTDMYGISLLCCIFWLTVIDVDIRHLKIYKRMSSDLGDQADQHCIKSYENGWRWQFALSLSRSQVILQMGDSDSGITTDE